jgi:hypothetical protein
MALFKLTRLFKNKKIITSLRITIFLFIAAYSVYFVLSGSEEGLIQSKENQINQRSELAKVLRLTESNSVIITQYHDKLLFPERKVVVGLFNDKSLVDRYARLAAELPLYYYNFTFPQKDIDYLNEKRLAESGLQIKPVETVTDSFTLYQLNFYEKK